ncbi:large-conductance mechanosensitive channel protein MscL [Corynebacterium freneyi]|uniref:Large-conductance mechanosensitive channel n=1 Tax=Corynebacterium freneyi DNF00450 TaxID=1287475 RepID=A0A095YAS3_9CORY|nr:large-conductance mechanosensitive channel protein MscL [Corynebacterium freneyi]KGF19191.1 mechanosensitive ion channel protein MscL [Corynebacterium freneyi DNF00450]MDK8768620.1 large-conductance mechanosensitive channel protein MscL [Corynebacterium freneyi]
MLAGFKEFIMRGNVIDLAVGVVIGAAFTSIVTAFTDNLLQPLINAVGGTDAADGLGFRILPDNPATFMDFGSVISAAINFLLVAAVVYFVIVAPMNKFNEIREAKLQTPAEEEVTEADLLTEIRDLLAKQSGTPDSALNKNLDGDA